MKQTRTARETAVRLCTLGKQTQKILREKLLSRRFTPEETEEAVSAMVEAGYIDEEVYTKAFVSDSYRIKRHGHIRIKRELLQRGISEEKAEAAIAAYDADEQAMIAREISRRFDATKEREKLYRYFLSRGFSEEDIRGCLHE